MEEQDKKRIKAVEEHLKEITAKLDAASTEVNKATNRLDRERVQSLLDKRAPDAKIVKAHNSAVAEYRELFDLSGALERERSQIVDFSEREKEFDRYQRVQAIRRRAEAPRLKLHKAMGTLIEASQECMSLLMESPQTWADINANPGDILFPRDTGKDVYDGFQERSMRALLLGRALELGRIVKP